VTDVIAELIRPAASGSSDPGVDLARVRDWEAFCALVSRTECAALIHERLRYRARNVPPEVMEWLQEQHDRTAQSNNRLLDELGRVTTLLSAREIPALVLKGPVLAFLGTGLAVRPFHDLDLLIRPHDLLSASAALSSLGFMDLRSRHHDYHRVFVKMVAHSPTLIELHFDLIDRERRYLPDIPSIWDRAVSIEILGRTMCTPCVTDHLLLTIMQLPHHHWSPRLLGDIGHVTTRWRDAIDWTEFVGRARAWGMRVLAGATLHAAASLLHVALPPVVTEFAKPGDYIQRLQWRLVQEALSEQLRLKPPRLSLVTPFMVADRPSAMFALMIRRTLGPKDRPDRRGFSAIVHRLWAGAVSVPPVLSILARTVRAANERESASRTGKIH
jgi:hypothetical protein